MNRKIKHTVDELSEKIFGKSFSDCRKENICVSCHKNVGDFRDSLSEREFNISGLCQECQDEIFTEDFPVKKNI